MGRVHLEALRRLGNVEVVSTSPELCLRAATVAEGPGVLGRFDHLLTIPIKGTRPRGADAASDAALVRELDADPKERAELAMIVDVERHDLGRVSRAGSVRVLGAPTVATLLPAVMLDGATPPPPARALIDAGAAVAIASNFNPHRTPTWNMQTVIAMACRDLGMKCAEAISAATINGAHALGRADRAGSLEPGKAADILLLNTDDCVDLCRYFGVNLVYMTIKRGSVIYREGELRTRP